MVPASSSERPERPTTSCSRAGAGHGSGHIPGHAVGHAAGHGAGSGGSSGSGNGGSNGSAHRKERAERPPGTPKRETHKEKAVQDPGLKDYVSCSPGNCTLRNCWESWDGTHMIREAGRDGRSGIDAMEHG